MDYYLTGPSRDVLTQALISAHEATTGTTIPPDETGQKRIPQNDGTVQWNAIFEFWETSPGVPNADGEPGWQTPPGYKPGVHALIRILQTPQNPQGLARPQDIAMLEAAGIEVLRADEIDPAQLALLPKFQ